MKRGVGVRHTHATNTSRAITIFGISADGREDPAVAGRSMPHQWRPLTRGQAPWRPSALQRHGTQHWPPVRTPGRDTVPRVLDPGLGAWLGGPPAGLGSEAGVGSATWLPGDVEGVC